MTQPCLKRSVTIDDVISFAPCLNAQQVEAFFGGKKRMTLADLARMPVESLSYPDRLRLFLREDFLPAKTLHLLACTFAERALRRERKAGREPDTRSWNVIRVKRRWIDGKATDDELASASWVAWAASAARDASAAWAARAAWAASAASVASVAWAAREASAASAARDASVAWAASDAWAAECRWQYRKVLAAMRKYENVE